MNPQEKTIFLLSPHKISVAALIQVYMSERPKLTHKCTGNFCILIIRLIQGLDVPFQHFKDMVKSAEVPEVVLNKSIEKLVDIKSQGLGSLMELINGLKALGLIHKTSVVGLFNRRMVLYFDKLCFSAMTRLYDEFCSYISERCSDDEMKDDNELEVIPAFQINTCPKQLQYFISKQLKLIEINEVVALNPKNLHEVFKTALKCGNETNLLSANSTAVNMIQKNDLNDLNFLRYYNSLRINEYPGARESLFAYFDGMNNMSSRCWAALNLAILHSHFNHTKLALEAIKECICAAQESNEERCLEFALIWITKVLAHEPEEVKPILNHLQKKATKLDLHYLAGISLLQYEELSSPEPRIQSDNTAEILAVKHSLNELLMMSYSCRAANFALIGGNYLNALTSQILLHLQVTERVGNHTVYRVNENTCIGIRNLALYLWRNHGDFALAKDLLVSLADYLFPVYKNKTRHIWQEALAEIKFEYYLFEKNWKNSLEAVNSIKSSNPTEAKIRYIELKIKQGNKEDAFDSITEFLNQDNDKPLTKYNKIRLLRLKCQVLSDITVLFKAINLAKISHLKGLEIECLLELVYHLHQLRQFTQCLNILNDIMIAVFANGTCYQIGRANYAYALCKLNTDNVQNLQSVLDMNTKSIDAFRLLNDKDSLEKSYILQAQIYNAKGDLQNRNKFARQARFCNSGD